jgi:nitrogen regulatory protein PII
MKRIEVVITPWALDAFKEAAPRLGISEFDIVQIYRSGGALAGSRQQLYRGCEFTADLSRLRLEFLLFDDKVQSTLHQLCDLVHLESITVFKLDQHVRTTSPTNGNLKQLFPANLSTMRAGHPARSDTSLSAATVTNRART